MFSLARSLNVYKPALTRKPANLHLLYSLATLASANTSSAPTILPSLAPPRTQRSESKSTRPPDEKSIKKHGESKAELLRKYREKLGRPHLSEDALLRDALYILQGISGKYVRLVEGDEAAAELKLVFEEDPVSMVFPGSHVTTDGFAAIYHLES